MVAHRGLRKPEWSRQFADACLTVRMGADDAQQSEARRVGKHAKGSRQPFRRSSIEGFSEQLRTTLGIDRLDQLHSVILTAVDTSVNVSTFIYILKEVTDGFAQRPVLPG
jgi:hypothetical protein